MGQDTFQITVNCIKLVLVFLMMVQAVPILVWLERRGSAFIQNRLGPNRVGPLGLMQLLADAVKFLTKEEFFPAGGVKFLYYAAPVAALVPATLAFAAIPMSAPVHIDPFEMFGKNWGPYTFFWQGFEINVGIVYILGVSSLGAYSILMAGWGSGNKYSLLGALRASAQIISYELALGLSIVGIILLYGTFNLGEMIAAQQGLLHFQFLGHTVESTWLPNWGIFYQPLAAVIFFAATFAESNRLPFDLAEGEAELVAGFHVEYGGFKMLLFFIGEYGHMMVAAGLMTTFFFGGWSIPGVSYESVYQWAQGAAATNSGASLLAGLIHFLVWTVKFAIFLWIFIQVRWTLPRFRYDQLMDLGWKTMLPWALGNTIITAIVLLIAHS
ncbi:MAG: NADH-quinone oxidoreductase subunit H [Bdellovibrio sp. CG10_big_fil_rev_8_21_14_0_10_47_8]|nr:MAG: NADH-quinone oxidoreductase subunit H [Bdellovibrio sp. CG10_big_fil_rev_8_21_14_0_10_47_8]